MVQLSELVTFTNDLLEVELFQDYCPNGLQVEGASEVVHLVTGVTASQSLIDAAIEQEADAILVHHGYFWRGENQPIVGMKQRRIKALLDNHISLLAYHLPLDTHPTFGNNVQLASRLGLQVEGQLLTSEKRPIGLYGQFEDILSLSQVMERLRVGLNREPLHVGGQSDVIHSVAWCTGAAQGFIESAAELGVDAYISGEVSEQTVHVARERGIHYFAAGHHATERYGVQALGAHLADQFAIRHTYIDIENPV